MPRLFRSAPWKPPKSWERMDEDQQYNTNDYPINLSQSSEKRYGNRSSQDKYPSFALDDESIEWDKNSTSSLSPTSVTDDDTFSSKEAIHKKKKTLSSQQITSIHKKRIFNQKQDNSQASRLKVSQALDNIFTAFWDRADLYTDVLDLENDKPSPRELRLFFFRRGRTILATPIESSDDMTMMSLGIKSKNRGTVDCDSSSMSIIQSGVTVSRKAKMRFWAISLAYEILNDEVMRKHYHEWRLWNPRMSRPSFEEEEGSIIRGRSTGSISSSNEKLSTKELSEIIDVGVGVEERQDRDMDVESRISVTSSMYSNTNSILHSSRYGNKKMNRIASNKTNRKIRWNEEVEELVILEDDYKENNDSMESIDRIESRNDPRLQDIGGLQLARNDDSISASVDLSLMTIRDLDESKLKSISGTYGNNISIHTENSADSSFGESVHTTNSSNRLLSKESKRRFNAKPIRVAKDDSSHTQHLGLDCMEFYSKKNRKSKHHTSEIGSSRNTEHCTKIGGKDESSNFRIELPSEKNRKSRHHDYSSGSVSSWNTEQSTTIEGGKDSSSNFRIKIKAPPKDTAANRSKAGARKKCGKPVYDSESEFGKDFVASDTNANDCAVGLAVGGMDCNSFPFSRTNMFASTTSDKGNHGHHNDIRNNDDDHGAEKFPLLSDFHSHLTNYVTEAVAEMKDGLSTLGKKWDDLDFDKIGANSFFLQGPEIDALMGILNEEGSTSNNKSKCLG